MARQLLRWGGPGLVELMVRATQENAVYYEGGKRTSEPPIRSGIRLFTGRKTVPVGRGTGSGPLTSRPAWA
ncbi:MAG: hypothetical protein VX815_00570, partial [Gemmatimonadota bacterium]|nr:hypothetical protein [Gemmatimonadota bacterium]